MITTRRDRLVRDATAIVALGAPLLGNNLSITGMAFADTVMAGQLGGPMPVSHGG
jgi:Na+-driven multidrug efflux pump